MIIKLITIATVLWNIVGLCLFLMTMEDFYDKIKRPYKKILFGFCFGPAALVGVIFHLSMLRVFDVIQNFPTIKIANSKIVKWFVR